MGRQGGEAAGRRGGSKRVRALAREEPGKERRRGGPVVAGQSSLRRDKLGGGGMVGCATGPSSPALLPADGEKGAEFSCRRRAQF